MSKRDDNVPSEATPWPPTVSNDGQRERIVVIGGGFAGLNFIKSLGRDKYDVILVDTNNYHSFPPLFYQVASSGLEPASISFPFRRELRRHKLHNVRFNIGQVKSIDVTSKTISTQFETLHYDRLVIAAGTTNNFFGMDDLLKTVYTIKSTSEAIRCRNDILDRLEQASLIDDPVRRRELLNFVVVGGGPTGVEIAGAIGEMKKYILSREYPDIDVNDMTITIIEGTDRLLRTMSERSSADARRYLEALMVDVRLGQNVKSYTGNLVTLTDGAELSAGMVIWTAGVKGVSFEVVGGELPVTRGGRIEVDGYNRVKGLDDVYALGDICISDADPAFKTGHPQLAQVAIQQGKLLARNFTRKPSKPAKIFIYKDKGSMATVGRNRAVVEIKSKQMHGFVAWFTWMAVHLVSLLGMRNRLVVFFNWLWAYFSYGTSLRLLIHPSKYPIRKRWEDDEDKS